MQTSAKVHLCAFADGQYASRKNQFLAEAERLNVFDNVLFFDHSMLSNGFRELHNHFMHSHRRGFGYWIWKPHVIEMALETASPGDVIVYLDAGFTLNTGGRNRFLEYIDITLDSPDKMLSFQNTHTEHRWTKADLAKRLGVLERPSIMSTSQLSSGFILLGNTGSNGDLVREWKEIAVENNYHYSDDTPSETGNHVEFKEHRHDQSISSLLRKVRGTAITHYEVQSYARYFDSLKSQLPAWATRLRA
jgi:hypothetical protein